MAFWGYLHELHVPKISTWIWMMHEMYIHLPRSQCTTSCSWYTALEAMVCLLRVQDYSCVKDFSARFQMTSNQQIHCQSFLQATSHGWQAAYVAWAWPSTEMDSALHRMVMMACA
jgi:hypothetical protein